MKRLLSVFISLCILAPSVSLGAIVVQKQSAVKKAAPVASESSGGLAGGLQSATGVLGSVMGLVQGIQKLKKDQHELSAGCAPSSSDKEVVNNLVKEWAKIGDTSAAGARDSVGGQNVEDGDYSSYENCMADADKDGCYEKFKDNKEPDQYYIWAGYPKASSGKLDNKKDISNIYIVLGKIPFGPEDYTESELSKVRGLLEKAERCAPDTISKKKRELWGNFLVGTISSVGSSTGAAGVSDVVGMAQSLGATSGAGGISTVLSSFGGQALQSFNK